MSRNRDGNDRAVPAYWLVFFAAIAAEFAALVWWVRRRFLRYEISGASMSPALEPGDYVIVDRKAYRRRVPGRRDIVLATDPRESARTLVKRVDHVDLHGGAWLLGDNPEESTDSRNFGAIDRRHVLGRVRWRYWPVSAWFRVR